MELAQICLDKTCFFQLSKGHGGGGGGMKRDSDYCMSFGLIESCLISY